jgi:mycofactocin system FadH/OYE family oxidoreductase 2
MAESFPNLLSPGRIGSVRLRNRVVFLPHFTALGTDEGMPSSRHAYYYAERGKGGVGLVVMESQAIHPSGKMAKKFIDAYDERVIPHYRLIADMVHGTGAKLFGQLTHAGHTTLEHPPQILWAPTQMPEPSSFYNTKEMDEEDIRATIAGFAKAASNHQVAGFDGIEVKVAHDGLLRSFVSPFFNKRTDRYGGSYENRIRICLEVFEAVKKACGSGFPLGVRLCLDEFTEWGYALDFGVQLARSFTASGLIDYINTDAGTFSSFYMEIPPMYVPPDFAVYMSAALKEVVEIPVIAFGRINDPTQAEKILENKEADFIGMCRQLICDPETVAKTVENRTGEIRNCIACNEGCNAPPGQNLPLSCIQNPAAGNEERLGIDTFSPAARRKRIVVVGGGPAGMKVAEVSARRGHHVELFEMTSRLGGQVLCASKVPGRGEVIEVNRFLEHEIGRLGVKVRLDTPADQALVLEGAPDAVVVATGSVPFLPEAEWTRQPGVYAARSLFEEDAPRVATDGKAVVFDKDGYWQGVGAAEMLLDQKKKVILVTPHQHVGMELESTHQVMVLKRLFEKGVELLCYSDIIGYSGGALTVRNVFSGTETVLPDIDCVVLATGSLSVNGLYRSLKARHGEVYLVGDAASPRRIQQVIREANDCARAL